MNCIYNITTADSKRKVTATVKSSKKGQERKWETARPNAGGKIIFKVLQLKVLTRARTRAGAPLSLTASVLVIAGPKKLTAAEKLEWKIFLSLSFFTFCFVAFLFHILIRKVKHNLRQPKCKCMRATTNARIWKWCKFFFTSSFVSFALCVSVCHSNVKSPRFHFICRFGHLINSNAATVAEPKKNKTQKQIQSEKWRRSKWQRE